MQLEEINMYKFIVAFAVLVVLMFFAGKRYTQAQLNENSKKRQEVAVHGNFDAYKEGSVEVYSVSKGGFVTIPKVYKPKDEWRKLLSKMDYHVAFEAGTERPYTGELNANKKRGVYRSKVSGNDLFHSDHKFDSGTGWPSFYRPVDEQNIELREDNSLFMKRIEVVDAVSGAHLGHVFEDGPPPTGLRYCINSAALEFVEGVDFKEPPKKE